MKFITLKDYLLEQVCRYETDIYGVELPPDYQGPDNDNPNYMAENDAEKGILINIANQVNTTLLASHLSDREWIVFEGMLMESKGDPGAVAALVKYLQK